MSNEQIKVIPRRIYEEVYSRGNAEALSELVSNDVTDHNPLPGQPRGQKGMRRAFEQWRAAFPDMTMTVEAMVTEGNWVHVRARMSGTHKGDFLGIKATGRTVEMPIMSTFRVQNERITEWYHVEDLASFLQQVGVITLGNRVEGDGRKGRNEAQRL